MTMAQAANPYGDGKSCQELSTILRFSMSMNHCVFYRTDLKYDGRVCAIIRTLASSFPDDQIFLFDTL